MRTLRKTGMTVLTAGIALTIGAVPVALTVPSIVGSSGTMTTLTPATWVPAGYLELTTTSANTAKVKMVNSSGDETVQSLSATNCVPLVGNPAITGPTTEPSLLYLQGVGTSKGKVGPLPVGLLKGAFGVQDKGTGTSCGQVDSDAKESLKLTLGDSAVGVIGPVLASSALLDLDLKGGANIIATATGPGGVSFQRELQSGSSIDPSDKDNLDVLQCNPGSDSGADSGSNDNCNWPIQGDTDEYFNSVTLRAVQGSFALSGGADYISKSNPSRIDLVEEIDGLLDCGKTADSIADEGTNTTVKVERLANADGTDCSLIPYTLRNGAEDTQFLKPLDEEVWAQFIVEASWSQPGTGKPEADLTPSFIDFEIDPFNETELAFCPDYVYQADGTIGITESVLKDLLDGNNANGELPDYEPDDGSTVRQFGCTLTRSAEVTEGEVVIHDRNFVIGDVRMRL